MSKDYQLHLKGSVGDWNFSPDMVDYVLSKHKAGEVHVLIDSLGGRVNAALSISAAFRTHGNVHCHYVGMSASAATIASMGAKRITMDANALFLVHKCMNLVFEWDWLNADELAEHIAKLEKMKDDQQTIDGCIAGLYASRCKTKTKDEILDLMKKGGWLTAKEAKEWGFIDEITDEPEDAKPEITEDVVDTLAEAGIPMPPLEAKKGSMLARIASALTSLFTTKPADEAATVADDADTTPTQITMDKFTFLVAVLGAAITASADNSFALSEDQLKKVNDELANQDKKVKDLEADVKAKDTKIAELEAKVAELNKKPAEETHNVVESGKGTNEGPGEDTMAEVNGLMAQLL